MDATKEVTPKITMPELVKVARETSITKPVLTSVKRTPVESTAKTEPIKTVSKKETINPFKRKFITRATVVDVSFFEQEKFMAALSRSMLLTEDDDPQFIEWNTNWDFSGSAKIVSSMLRDSGLPNGMTVLLKMYHASNE